MTQEEKAKAYDDALERAKRIKDGNGNWRFSDLSEIAPAVTEIFPELCESGESKDERVVNQLISLVESTGGVVLIPTNKDELIAWLEKQKALSELGKYIAAERTKPGFMFAGNDSVSWEELPLDVRKHDYPYYFIGDLDCYPFDVEKQKEQKPNIEICPHSVKSKSYSETGYPIEDCDYGLEIALNILEKTLGKVQGFQTDDGIREHQTAIKAVKEAMKEQKPAEWSDTKELVFKDICKHLKEEGYNGWVLVLNALRNGEFKQPVAEWSEEDDAFRELLICILKAEHPNDIFSMSAKQTSALKCDVMPINRIIAWLKSLHPQPKQEWNEKDEKILDSLIRLYSIEYSANAWPWANGVFTYGDVVNFLKSLRPDSYKNCNSRWAPSEEQISALEYFIRSWGESGTMSPQNPTLCAAKSLYNDLKKLI